MNGNLETMETRVNRQDQYSRRPYLLLHGIKESNHEEINNLALEVLNEKLEVSINESDIDRCHRIGIRIRIIQSLE